MSDGLCEPAHKGSGGGGGEGGVPIIPHGLKVREVWKLLKQYYTIFNLM